MVGYGNECHNWKAMHFLEGKLEQTCYKIGEGRLGRGTRGYVISSKIMNRLIRAKNGNGAPRNQLKIIHWNAGSRLWDNKLIEIESLLLEEKPDMCYMSEANLWT